jgi:enoyl-CoA hydratase
MVDQKITYEVSGGVATLALDDPDTRNALSGDLLGDLAGLAADVSPAHEHVANERFPEAFRLLGELGKPSLCAANGHVLAGALGLALACDLACDLVVAREDARFGMPEIDVGLFRS